jgi:hypothetical protein
MFAAPLSLSQIVKRDGIEVVVGEQNEPEAEPAQLFTSWITALAIRWRGCCPSVFHGAEGTVFRTPAHCLGPIPTYSELAAAGPTAQPETPRCADASPFVHGLDATRSTVVESTSPQIRSPSPRTTLWAAPCRWASSGNNVT